MGKNVRAQELLHKALMRIWKQCGYANNAKDASEFAVVILAVEVAIIVELAAAGTTLREPDGVDKMVAFHRDLIGQFLRDSAKELFEKERKTPRQ